MFWKDSLCKDYPKDTNTPYQLDKADSSRNSDRYAAANFTGFVLQGFMAENSVRY